jgi:hypothetical protein
MNFLPIDGKKFGTVLTVTEEGGQADLRMQTKTVESFSFL